MLNPKQETVIFSGGSYITIKCMTFGHNQMLALANAE